MSSKVELKISTATSSILENWLRPNLISDTTVTGKTFLSAFLLAVSEMRDTMLAGFTPPSLKELSKGDHSITLAEKVSVELTDIMEGFLSGKSEFYGLKFSGNGFNDKRYRAVFVEKLIEHVFGVDCSKLVAKEMGEQEDDIRSSILYHIADKDVDNDILATPITDLEFKCINKSCSNLKMNSIDWVPRFLWTMNNFPEWIDQYLKTNHYEFKRIPRDRFENLVRVSGKIGSKGNTNSLSLKRYCKAKAKQMRTTETLLDVPNSSIARVFMILAASSDCSALPEKMPAPVKELMKNMLGQ